MLQHLSKNLTVDQIERLKRSTLFMRTFLIVFDVVICCHKCIFCVYPVKFDVSVQFEECPSLAPKWSRFSVWNDSTQTLYALHYIPVILPCQYMSVRRALLQTASLCCSPYHPWYTPTTCTCLHMLNG